MDQPLPSPGVSGLAMGIVGRVDGSMCHLDRGESSWRSRGARDGGRGRTALCGHLGGCLEARPTDLCFEVQMGFAWAEVAGQ